MRLLVLALVALAAGCPRTLSEDDRAALQDFRTVDHTATARAEAILHDDSIRLSPSGELAKAVERELVAPWQAMRARTKLAERRLGDTLGAAMRRYLDERELAWKELAQALATDGYGPPPVVNHRWQFRDSTEAADKDRAIIEGELAHLKLPALPPLPVPPSVELVMPPPVPTPGAAYFLVGRSVVRLDDAGLRTIATDVDSMDVLPDGRMWGCGPAHLALWTGTQTSDYASSLSVTLCAAAPDGTVWVLDDRTGEGEIDQLGRFDGKRWTMMPVAVRDPAIRTEQLMVDRDGRLYSVIADVAGARRLFVLDQKRWRELALTGGVEPSSPSLHRGGDGRVWIRYAVDGPGTGLRVAALTPAGPGAPIDLPAGVSTWTSAVIDAAGVITGLDRSSSTFVQGARRKQLAIPLAYRPWSDEPNSFALDGAGRLWVDLADGLHVIAKGDQHTVFPRGSVAAITQNIRRIIVLGAGPTKLAPGPVVTRTITGQILGAGKVELVLCGDRLGGECPPGLPAWKTYSDAEGHFTFEKVPRWTFPIHAVVGLTGKKTTQELDTTCCAGPEALGELRFVPGPLY